MLTSAYADVSVYAESAKPMTTPTAHTLGLGLGLGLELGVGLSAYADVGVYAESAKPVTTPTAHTLGLGLGLGLGGRKYADTVMSQQYCTIETTPTHPRHTRWG